MRRVLVLIKGLGRGGAEQLLLSAAPHWDRTRFDYEVAYLLEEKDALVAPLQEEGVGVRRVAGSGFASWMAGMRRLIAETRPDLVHVHLPYAAMVARAASPTRRGPRIVYTEHGPWDHYQRPTYWGNAATYWRNDHVFAVSEGVRRSIRYPAGLRMLRMPRVETLHHGLDTRRLVTSSNGVREELGIRQDAPLVGMVANFRAQKRHDLVLQAAANVKQRIPEARFLLVGTGPLEADMKRLAAQLDLGESVIFAGFREDARGSPRPWTCSRSRRAGRDCP